MKKLALILTAFFVGAVVAHAGPEQFSGKEMKQVVPPPCPEWYADTEWNVSAWGTYIFTAEDWDADKYIESDHAWGGGLDLKYFFHRYFGVGVEGWVADARRFETDVSGIVGFIDNSHHENRLVGSTLGTFTFRYPLQCSRFAPYVWGGAGAVFGGGERDEVVVTGNIQGLPIFDTIHHDGEAKFAGQVGAGFEVRLTRHIGLTNDFSWNFIARDNSDFGMVRSGINFAF